jgi:hypothetical protein
VVSKNQSSKKRSFQAVARVVITTVSAVVPGFLSAPSRDTARTNRFIKDKDGISVRWDRWALDGAVSSIAINATTAVALSFLSGTLFAGGSVGLRKRFRKRFGSAANKLAVVLGILPTKV